MHKNVKKEDNKMITISKTFETFRKDVNSENSTYIAAFEKITSFLFRGIVVLGVPLIIYMLLFL
jgi:flagellar biosynthesis protein FliR